MADPTKAALAAAWAVQQIGSQAWNEYCERLIENAYGTSGRYPSAAAAAAGLPLYQDPSAAEPGDLVYFKADDTNNGYGHAGIYVGNGRMVSATPSGVKETSILQDPYYGPRFVGFAKAPADWKGQTSTRELAAGADRILAAAQGKVVNVPEDPRVTTATQQIYAAQDRLFPLQVQLEAAQRNLDALDPKKVPASQFDTVKKALQDRVDSLTAAVNKEQAHIEGLQQDIAKVQAENQQKADAEPKGTVREQGSKIWFFPSDGSAPKDVTPQGWQPDQANVPRVTVGGKVYERSPDGKWTSVIDTTTEADTKKDELNLKIAQLNFNKAQLEYDEATSPEAKRLKEIQLKQAEAALIKAQQPQTFQGRDGRQYRLSDDGTTATPITGDAPAIKTASTEQGLFYSLDEGQTWTKAEGLPAPEPKDVTAPPSQQFLIRRKADGSFEQTENPNYQPQPLADPGAQYIQERTRLQALATQERDRLLALQHNGTLSAQQAEQQFQDFFQSKVMTPLSGLRAMADRQRQQDLLAQEAAQRAENERADTINRQREQYAFESGQALRADAANRVQDLRSPAFLGNMAQLTNNWLSGNFSGGGVNFTPQSFQLQPSQIPNLDAIASQQTAQALAHISPAAAAKVGGPLPGVEPLPDINQYLPQFQPPGPAASGPNQVTP